MISGSLYFKLLREDFKRRAWAIALVFLAFFFSLPVGLAMSMENAANTNYRVFNDDMEVVRSAAMTDSQWAAKLLEMKTRVVVSSAGFGNIMVVLLMTAVAVVIGISSFSYLHNRRKVDFYHSMPVRRETLFLAQYTGGAFIVAASYLASMVLMAGVSVSYGVSLGGILGTMAGGWALNVLYFLLMYGTVTVAMLLTGKIVVGVLASGIFFFFIPSIMLLLIAYCQTFFVTTTRYMWSDNGSFLTWAFEYLSPFSVYMTALGWKPQEMGSRVPIAICSILAFLAISLLAVWLYRRRPSESAGKAMAFGRTMAPIRMLIVLGSGLGGGMFFWMLQSSLKWGIFGVVVSIVIAHCVIEVIYQSDFKKLFSHKLQLALCLTAGVLIFLSFRYDWYGYDSYIPRRERVASASLEISEDSSWLDEKHFNRGKDGRLQLVSGPIYEYIEDNMALTDLDSVLAIAQEGKSQVRQYRDLRLNIREAQASSVSMISSDGPKSVFLASSVGEDEGYAMEYTTEVTVCYRLTNGKEARRSYTIPLSAIKDSYETIFAEKEYKDGLYYILNQDPASLVAIQYQEGGKLTEMGVKDSALRGRFLKAYQTDLEALTVEDKINQDPVGRIGFASADALDYYMQQDEWSQSYGNRPVDDPCQYWPVYASFTNTLALLEDEGVQVGSSFTPEHVRMISIRVRYQDKWPEGETLKALQRENPHYVKEGYLEFTDSKDIALIMGAMGERGSFYMNRLRGQQCEKYDNEVVMEDGQTLPCVLFVNRLTPEMKVMFKGLPLDWAME